jgi:hypothetical protein
MIFANRQTTTRARQERSRLVHRASTGRSRSLSIHYHSAYPVDHFRFQAVGLLGA